KPASSTALSENQAAVGDRAPHADPVVDPDRRRVLGPHEEADGGHAREEEAAEVAQAALRVALVPGHRVDPDLLELHRPRRPGRRLRLEEDHAVLLPEPRAPLVDLRPRAPAEALGVAAQRVDPDLLLVRGRTGRQEEVEVAG